MPFTRARAPDPLGVSTDRAGFGAALAIACTLTIAVVLALMAVQLLLIHPGITGYGGRTGLFNQQNQTVKSDLYLVGFVIILPGALVIAPRLVSRILAGTNAGALTVYSVLLAGSLAGIVILVRLSGALPWGSGVKGVLVGVLVWTVLAGILTRKVLGSRSWSPFVWLSAAKHMLVGAGGVLLLGVLLCLTRGSSLSVVPLVLGTAVSLGVAVAFGRLSLPRVGRRGLILDGAFIVILLFAIPDLVVFHNPSGIPSYLADPGLIQYQQGWLLGPTNQLLGGGALLVSVPVSQYGVGVLYFLAGWFRLAPIGYGTFGFLDGLLTALFYIAGYSLLRVAGIRRLLAASTLALGVLVLVYNFQYFVGQLPEEGPLRFGLPMLAALAEVAGTRWPRRRVLARFTGLFVLAVSAVWALEAFAYTTVTFIAAVGAGAWLAPRGERLRQVVRGLGQGAAAVVAAHAIFALATLAGTGQLPHWEQYLAYVHALLLGGQAGEITYGFANWSPGLAVYGGALVSAAAFFLVARYRPKLARRNATLVVALAATTAYSIALLSYADNRSSTYFFLYVSLPLLLAAALWLGLVLSDESRVPRPVRRGALTAALGVAVLLFSGAWPSIGSHFSRTALARAYPGGGLLRSLDRLWRPPPIDPRAPEGVRLLDRYMPARRSLILLPTSPDLGTEILMRSGRANLLPIGDPEADSLVPTVWLPRMRLAVRQVKAGQRVLVNLAGLHVLSELRRSSLNAVRAPIEGGSSELEWILHALDERFKFLLVHRGSDGLLVDRLVRR